MLLTILPNWCHPIRGDTGYLPSSGERDLCLPGESRDPFAPGSFLTRVKMGPGFRRDDVATYGDQRSQEVRFHPKKTTKLSGDMGYLLS